MPRIAAAWARIHLVAGQSPANFWQVDDGTPRAQLAVGTQRGCDWTVGAAGVAPVHFKLRWDGQQLWIADTRRAGGVTLDGAPVDDWKPVSGGARIEFGAAAMVVESSTPAAPAAASGAPVARPAFADVTDEDDTTWEPLSVHVAPTVRASASLLERLKQAIALSTSPPAAPPASIQPRASILGAEDRASSRGPGAMSAGLARTPAPEPISQTPAAPRSTPTGQPARPAPAVPGPATAVVSPLRTWLLIGATFAALVGVMFMGDERRDRAPARASARPQEPVAPPAPGQPAAPPPAPAAAGAAVSPPAERASSPAPVSPREAAELLLAGRDVEALAAYRGLAAAYPESRAYAAIVKVLKRRLASRCDDGQPGTGAPCAGPP